MKRGRDGKKEQIGEVFFCSSGVLPPAHSHAVVASECRHSPYHVRPLPIGDISFIRGGDCTRF